MGICHFFQIQLVIIIQLYLEVYYFGSRAGTTKYISTIVNTAIGEYSMYNNESGKENAAIYYCSLSVY